MRFTCNSKVARLPGSRKAGRARGPTLEPASMAALASSQEQRFQGFAVYARHRVAHPFRGRVGRDSPAWNQVISACPATAFRPEWDPVGGSQTTGLSTSARASLDADRPALGACPHDLYAVGLAAPGLLAAFPGDLLLEAAAREWLAPQALALAGGAGAGRGGRAPSAVAWAVAQGSHA